MSGDTDIRLAITQLASFACRTGDLLPDAVAGPSAREGMRAHSQLQQRRMQVAENPDQLSAEYRVSLRWTAPDRVIQLGGRIDLIDTSTHQLTEIKSTYVPGEHVPASRQALQWAQLYLYGFVYLQQLSDASVEDVVTQLDLELVHVNLRDNSQQSQMRRVSAVELMAYAETALQCYCRWLDKLEHWHSSMQGSTNTLAFPFKQFRQGQRDMAVAVYRSCRDATPLMCEAATGIGKTLSTLYPAIKSMGEGSVKQIVFLTAKVAGRRSAEEAVRHLTDTGLRVTMIQLRAKASSCFCHTGECERDESGRCPMTLGFYDRLPDARDELLSLGVIGNSDVQEVAWQHQLCPFALAQQLLPWVHIVIADYNYVFDPLVKLPHFTAANSRAVLLVDEAHNLLDRARMMYSAQLDRENCKQVADECRVTHPLIARALDKVDRQLASVGRKVSVVDSKWADATGVETQHDPPAALARAVSDALQQLYIAMSEAQLPGDQLHTLALALSRYSVINELFKDRYRFVVETCQKRRRKQVTVSLFCIDPSQALARSYRTFRSIVVFSATLRPAAFHRDSLGIDKAAQSLQLPSPFDAQRCFRCVVDWVDTRYRNRDSSIQMLVQTIRVVTQAKTGNYLVFFPSFAYLDMAYDAYRVAYPSCKLWSQTRMQSREEQQSRVDALDQSSESIGFAIQGGVFGEGIDYKGDRLIGTLIIGTGLPALNWQSDLVADFYRQRGQDGYEFAYKFPGFTRVLQSAGRVIRGEHDAGVVVLIDPRFTNSDYRRLFPADWQMTYPAGGTVLTNELTKFWRLVGAGVV